MKKLSQIGILTTGLLFNAQATDLRVPTNAELEQKIIYYMEKCRDDHRDYHISETPSWSTRSRGVGEFEKVLSKNHIDCIRMYIRGMEFHEKEVELCGVWHDNEGIHGFDVNKVSVKNAPRDGMQARTFLTASQPKELSGQKRTQINFNIRRTTDMRREAQQVNLDLD